MRRLRQRVTRLSTPALAVYVLLLLMMAAMGGVIVAVERSALLAVRGRRRARASVTTPSTPLLQCANFTAVPDSELLNLPPLHKSYDFAAQCRDVALEGAPAVTQRCCWLDDGPPSNDSPQSCLPHLVVAGGLKSLTTGLHSWLLFHPQVRALPPKEMYTFDDREVQFGSFVQGVFSSKTLLPMVENKQRINVDSTPTYVDSLMSCQRMAYYLHPSSKFVYVLRNPVERKWSLYLMAHRRRYARRLSLFKFWSKLSFEAFMRCVRGKGRCVIPAGRAANPQSETWVNIELLYKYVMKRAASDLLFWSSDAARCFASPKALAACMQPQGAFGDLVPESFHEVRGFASGRGAAYQNLLCKSRVRALDEPAVVAARAECDRCSAQQPTRVLAPTDSDKCVGCRCHCLSVLANHSVLLLLPRHTLEHCFEHIDRSRFLVLDYAAAAPNMSAHMSRVVKHAGLAPFDFSNVTNELADARFEREISPSFKENTGWAHDLAPKWYVDLAMPSVLAGQWRTFVNKDVDYLRRLTGLELSGW